MDNFLVHFSQVLSVLPVIAGLVFRKYLDSCLYWFWIYAITMCSMELISELVALIVGANLFLYPIYALLHFQLIVVVFINFNELLKYKIKLVWLFPVFLLLIGIEYFFINETEGMPSLTMIGGSFILIFLVFLVFYELLQQPNQIPLKFQPRFLISTSIIIYSGSTIFYFLLFNYFAGINWEKNIIGFDLLSQFHAFINCIFYIINMFVFISQWKAKTSSSYL